MGAFHRMLSVGSKGIEYLYISFLHEGRSHPKGFRVYFPIATQEAPNVPQSMQDMNLKP